jgi:hypothetical protein
MGPIRVSCGNYKTGLRKENILTISLGGLSALLNDFPWAVDK